MAKTLSVTITGDAGGLKRAFGDAVKSSEGFGRSLEGVSRGAKIASAALLGGLAFAAKAGFSELAEGQKVSAQTEAVLKSTGGAANTTATEIEKLASSISAKTGIDDEAIQAGENLLLTFTNLRNETGKGNDVFNQATLAIADMSVAMGTDMKSAALQVGKALNDPLKGLSALTRVGVTFTAGQKAQIKALVASGKSMEAQKLILKELNKEFGGSAEAAGKTLPGQLAKAKLAFEEAAAGLTESLLPAFSKLAQVVSGVSKWMTEHQGATKVLVVTLAGLATSVFAVSAAFKAYRAAALVATAAQVVFNVAVSANPYVLAAVAIAALVGALILLEVKFGLVSKAARAVLDFFKNNWQEIATLILLPLAAPVAAITALATDAFGIRSALVKALTGVASAMSDIADKVGDFLKAIPSKIASFITAASTKAKELGGKIKDGAVAGVTGAAGAVWDVLALIGTRIASFAATILAWGAGIGAKIKSAAVEAIGGVAGAVWNVIEAIGTRIAALAATVVGWGSAVGSKVKSGAVSGVTGIGGAVWTGISSIGARIEALAGTIAGWGRMVGNALKGGVVKVASTIGGAVEKALSVIYGIVSSIVAAINAITDAANAAINAVKSIPHPFAPATSVVERFKPKQHGGPVRAGQGYIVGEKGPELFWPETAGKILPKVPSFAGMAGAASLSGMTSGSTSAMAGPAGPMARAGGGGINVTVNVHGNAIYERDLAKTVRDELVRMAKRNAYGGGGGLFGVVAGP